MDVNKVIVGECSQVMSDMPKKCVDMILTSPPYDGVREFLGFEFDAKAVGKGMYRILKPGGVAVWVVADQTKGKKGKSLTSFRQAILFQDIGFRVHDVIINHREFAYLQNPGHYIQAHEYMFVISKGRPATFNPIMVRNMWPGRKATGAPMDPNGKKRANVKDWETHEFRPRTNVWTSTRRDMAATGRAGKDHPAVMLASLARDHIATWSNPGDLVLDPMCGSGTTLEMAAAAGRRWIGIEISPEYAGPAERRARNAPLRWDTAS